MEWNCEWITTDKGFKRFKGLKFGIPWYYQVTDAFIRRDADACVSAGT